MMISTFHLPPSTFHNPTSYFNPTPFPLFSSNTNMIQILKTSSSSSNPTPNHDLYHQQQQQHMKQTLTINTCVSHPDQFSVNSDTNTEAQETVERARESEEEIVERKRRRKQGIEETGGVGDQLHLVGLLFTALRKSLLGCSSLGSILNNSGKILSSSSFGMEIGLPTNVTHVAHVTFHRFHGFLGLPLEFQPHVPQRSPSASTTVFGVSTNSMQLSFDTRGNSVPTILLLMQHRLYALGGLQAEGIFRINPDNGQEEHVRAQLNRGLIPDNVDVHCLAGLIKAWFRELPTAVLDCLTPEQVMQSQTEEECAELVRLLPPTEAALLDWAVNLMADVTQFEHLNKMNARNIAMVFAPNMTHMADPLTALMHAVQVMNFLKTLIEKTLKEREDAIIDSALDFFSGDPSGGNGHHANLQTILEEATEPTDETDKPSKPTNPTLEYEVPTENIAPNENDQSLPNNHRGDETIQGDNSAETKGKGTKSCRSAKGMRKTKPKNVVHVGKSGEKAKGSSLVSSVNLRMERVEAWR